MHPQTPRTITAYYGISYTLRDDFKYGPAKGGLRFRILYLEDPDGHEFKLMAIANEAGTGPIYIPGGELAPPYERSIPTLWEHVPRYSWINFETGEKCPVENGVPRLPTWTDPEPWTDVPADTEVPDGDLCVYEHCAACDRAELCELAKL